MIGLLSRPCNLFWCLYRLSITIYEVFSFSPLTRTTFYLSNWQSYCKCNNLKCSIFFLRIMVIIWAVNYQFNLPPFFYHRGIFNGQPNVCQNLIRKSLSKFFLKKKNIQPTALHYILHIHVHVIHACFCVHLYLMSTLVGPLDSSELVLR